MGTFRKGEGQFDIIARKFLSKVRKKYGGEYITAMEIAKLYKVSHTSIKRTLDKIYKLSSDTIKLELDQINEQKIFNKK